MYFHAYFGLFSTLLSAPVLASGSSASPTSSRVPLPSWTGCPFNGSPLPRPTGLRSARTIQNATTSLANALDLAIKGEIKAGFDVGNTSFSIALVSPFGDDIEKDNGSIIWSYHHLGRNNKEGTRHLDDDSQYLIGSVSKVFTELLLLESDVSLEDPVTKYLPELDIDNSPIAWKNVTLSVLSNHLAGIPSNLPSNFEFYSLQPLYQLLGFPPLSNSSYEPCGVTGLNEACNEKQILEILKSALPVAPVYSQPAYSSLAFNLIALALSKKTGKPYDEMIDEVISKPLGLQNTGVSPGDTKKAVVPPLDAMSQGWGGDYGLNAPGGGLYSSLRDLSTLTARILDESIFATPEMTRRWLKPQSMGPLSGNLVGQPWEIQRTENLIPENPHVVDIYAKSGGANGYVSQLSVLDQYGVGFVVLTAGPREASVESILNDALISSLVPAIDREARIQAQKYTGNYSTTGQADTPENNETVSISLATDHGTGLKILSLQRNGSDILGGMLKLWDAMIPQTGILNPDFRLYPTGIMNYSETDSNIVFEDWRINFDIIPSDNAAMSELPGQGSLSSHICSSWQLEGWLYYGGEALDRVVFKVDRRKGTVVGVDIPFLRSTLLTKD